MKNNLNNAISYLESLNINVDSFYSITADKGGTTIQGDFQSDLIKILNQNDFTHQISNNGSLRFETFLNDQNIRIVFF